MIYLSSSYETNVEKSTSTIFHEKVLIIFGPFGTNDNIFLSGAPMEPRRENGWCYENSDFRQNKVDRIGALIQIALPWSEESSSNCSNYIRTALYLCRCSIRKRLLTTLLCSCYGYCCTGHPKLYGDNAFVASPNKADLSQDDHLTQHSESITVIDSDL